MTVETKSGIERLSLDFQAYKPFPKQTIFHQSTARYRLFGGAAGPGKSVALLMEGIKYAAELYDNVNVLILRRTLEELDGSIIINFLRMVPRELYKSYNAQKHRVMWHNGSVMKFGYCKLERDIWQYQGAEYIFVGWDETTQFTLKQWQTMKGWNRSTVGRGVMAGATNPVGVGWKWVKSLWIDHEPDSGMDDNERREYDPDEHHYIPATYTDNPHYANDRDYIKSLESLPTHLREALKEGRWDVRAGVYFDIFDPAVMCDRPEAFQIQPWWTKWISIDWGFDHPLVAYWHTQDGHRTFTYREFSCRKTPPGDAAEQICELSKQDGIQEKFAAIYLSPDAWAQRTEHDTIAHQMHKQFKAHGFPTVSMADNDRVGGAMLMYVLLRDGLWTIGNNCTDLIATLPMMQRDEKNVEDVLKMPGDDPYDSARYGIKSRLAPRSRPTMELIREKITSVDPTIQAIQIKKALAEQEKKNKPVRFHRRRKRRRRI